MISVLYSLYHLINLVVCAQSIHAFCMLDYLACVYTKSTHNLNTKLLVNLIEPKCYTFMCAKMLFKYMRRITINLRASKY